MYMWKFSFAITALKKLLKYTKYNLSYLTRQKLCHSNLESPPISPQTPVMMIKGKTARQKGLRKEANTLSHFFQKKTPVTPSSKAQSSLKLHVPVKSEPMEVCLQQLGNIKQDNVEDPLGMVKDEKMDVTVFPSTSLSKPLGKGDVHDMLFCWIYIVS